MNKAEGLFEKPGTRLSTNEWVRNIEKLLSESRTKRFDSYQLMQNSIDLRNNTRITTKWNTYRTNQLLRDRIFEVDNWYELQKFYWSKVNDELNLLKEAKNTSELYIESLQVPTMVTVDCINTRDRRNSTELTRDQLDEELKKELRIIEKNQCLMKDTCHDCWLKMNEVRDILNKLQREIDNKETALNIEKKVKDLNCESACISYKMNPDMVPAESMTPEGYVHYIEFTISRAVSLITESKTIRELLFKTRNNAKNTIYTQSQVVDQMLRRRVYDLERARNEIQWQKFKLESSMKQMCREIDSLHLALSDKVNPLKAVESRLEYRLNRPTLELVRDQVYGGMVEELRTLKNTKDLLQQQLDAALTSHSSLSRQLDKMKQDLADKNQSLDIESNLLEIRKTICIANESPMAINLRNVNMRQISTL